MSFLKIKKELKKAARNKQAKTLSRFFKTGKGEYGEGDLFLGVKVPDIRKVAKKYKDLELLKVEKLLQSKIHEYRLTALLILTYKFPQADEKERQKIVSLYLKNTKYINNWDLVDLSAPKIVGEYFLDKDRKILYKLAKSKDLWEKRIAILATYAFLRQNQLKDTIKISLLLLKDNHDLIHKAVGWMLRELGKKDEKVLTQFLEKHFKAMPRTMLRYSIERFEEKKRKYFLKK
ncbi:DNA alkylation repair protein [Candidatus Beckwithbacteria bacterium CG10_big_fil_rev_8_21_14_0_10_34_10]|uniref:DNA alkylation repair protein n=1 Tax=Candidatus Beckwithbacteria bacterium CG10_big_fil_rev_8_21_14_0_10_34_10 TaxID=1974495 RepID=A0A2H0WA96_9BACT|nr:MAG: DNA alkylation repair protein [Candidatus Beckwithbacteria bacterium CG10_big_fil_rev_8_21_14_0_10_34_10]